MSLDVYVMSLRQFKSGDVQTGLQRVFGGRAHILNPLNLFTLAPIKGFLARRRGKKATEELLAEAENILGIRLHWQDKGSIAYAEQASWGFQAFRAYAKWLDLQDIFPSFCDPPEGNFYNHPAMLWDGIPRKFRFSHIIDHCCYSGYFVPCRFDRVIKVEPYKSWGDFVFHHSFGSSYTLADQIEAIAPHMPSRSEISEKAYDLIHAGFEVLKTTATKSIEHQLPIIFWG